MSTPAEVLMGGAPAGASGWGSLGDAIGRALGGGGGSTTYDDAMLRGHRIQKALKDAQKASLEYQSLIDLEDTLEETFGPELARAAAGAARAGANFDQLARGRHSMLQGDATQAALEAVRAGQGLADVNPYLAVAGGKPVQLTKVEGNTIISPYEALSGQTPQLSPYGQGYLSNQASRVSGQNQADMARATQPRGTGSRSSVDPEEKARRDDIKATARQAYYQLRERARTNPAVDPQGITIGDIEYALETSGSWTSPAGDEYVLINQDVGGAMHPDLAEAIRQGAITPPPQVAAFTGTQSGGSSNPAAPKPPPAPAPGLPAATARGSASPAAAMSGAPVTEPKGQPSPGAGESLDHIPRLDLERGGLEGAEQAAGELPASARAALKEGVATTFANGQVWTLRNGAPVRLN